MKMKFWALLGSGLILAACNGQPDTQANSKQEQPASAPAQAQETATTPAPNELKSQDGKITIAVSGSFSDKSGDATLLPENMKAEELLLLQHDENAETTIYAMKSGEVADTKKYFAKLEQAIQADKSLKNTQVTANENKLVYHFSHTDKSGESALNESCVVAVADKQVYNVCASSEKADLTALDEIIGNVKIAP